MYHTPKTHWQLRLMNTVFVVLFLLAVGLLQWLAKEYHLQFDWTRMHRYSLSPASEAVMERLKEPLKITAFASQRGETRRLIQEMVGRYQKYKPDIQLEFVNPDTAPERVRAAGVQFEGELIFEYGDARENLPPAQFDEQNFTNALTRLGHRGERWVIFLSGHGERSPDKQANFDLSTWAAQIRTRGFKTRTLSLGEHPQIPQNSTVLVIASPRTRLLAGEVREIQNYLDRGGNLLWLHDPGLLLGLEPLAESLGIEFHPGVIVDPFSVNMGDMTAIVAGSYGPHPVVRNFGDVTLFPHACGISLNTPETWQGSILIDTRKTAWSETSSLEGSIRFDKGRDIRGPLNLAVALTRTLDNKREHRVVVVGDGDFLANTYLPNGGNLELGMSLVNWLSQDDAFVNIPIKTARDRSLDLSLIARNVIATGYVLVLPLFLVSSGIWIWLRRRKR